MAIDLTYLQEITGGDPDVMQEMLDLFIRDIPAQLETVKEFYDQKNYKGVGSEAHKLKPTLQYIGNTEMYELIKQIEFSGKNETDVDQIAELLDRMFQQLDGTIELLQAKRAELD